MIDERGCFSKMFFPCPFRKYSIFLLPDVKIEGVHNSSVVWFYSIQGLFKVVFELLNTAAQRDCLTKLKVGQQQTWARYNFLLLNVFNSPEYVIHIATGIHFYR